MTPENFSEIDPLIVEVKEPQVEFVPTIVPGMLLQ